MHPLAMLFALVGPERCGKSTLLVKLEHNHVEHVGIIKTKTTSMLSTPEERDEYESVSPLLYGIHTRKSQLVHEWSTKDAVYAITRNEIDKVLSHKHGILAASPELVAALKDDGYNVYVIGIEPMGNQPHERMQSPRSFRSQYQPDMTVINSFDIGHGVTNAHAHLQYIVRMFPLND